MIELIAHETPVPVQQPHTGGVQGTSACTAPGTQRRTTVLHCPPAPPERPEAAAEINSRVVEWMTGLGLGSAANVEGVYKHDPGRGITLCHPGSQDVDRMTAAGKMIVAETAVDDYFCETNSQRDSNDQTIGPNLSLAQSAIDAPCLTPGYQALWEEQRTSHPVLRAQHEAFEDLKRISSPAQAQRTRHDIAQLYLGYNAENGWRLINRLPPAWQYLANRQMNSFRPCLDLTDVLDGYELPDALHAHPLVQDCTARASLIATLHNDLASCEREIREHGLPFNLPAVIAAEERIPLDEAFIKACEVHNELIRAFEDDTERTTAALPDPVVARFLTGLWAWIAGSRHWHFTTARHSA
ncbi:2-methylisoborneol synthase [Saccharopolyspora kobensis]|uniref:Terpene synthase n=1 Tax=Saccharopolyspora kobensis TaxID=146035 RepID=A0A1H5ZJP9_9PSEU|nr:family 2 encapsulin nanocompartment cargo protein terpene cyclase [Saccharopolyspora kobensis]SEG35636.1 2-methylisoborneol synthase [Saccharopolyspora kobensis]SFF18370.1 2-methylisoborneol synthase [Saccharopolyspora kobensis]